MWNIKSRFIWRACGHTSGNGLASGARCPQCRFEAGLAMADIHRGLFEARKVSTVAAKPEDDDAQDLPVGY